MADIRPFPGFRYPMPPEELAQVVTPPYDVISPDEQARYYAQHPANIIRLELGQTTPDDDALDNPYTRAAATFAEWRRNGALSQDAPTFYVYQQEFSVGEQRYTRTSLVGRVRLEPWEAGIILPHERTMAKPKDDRLRLLRATGANLSPLMALYDDPNHAIAAEMTALTQGAPVAAITDAQGEQHRLWLIDDAATQARLSDAFADRQLFIADGHHRYETALAFRDEQREKHGDLGFDAAYNFVMMALVATDDPGLVVLPTHRLARGLSVQVIAALPETLPQFWDVEPLEREDAAALTQRLAEAGASGAHVAIVATHKHQWLLHLTPAGVERMSSVDEPPAWRDLDVALAQELILNAALGVTREAITTGDQVSYTRKAEDALAALAHDTAQVAILLNPTRPEQVRDVAQAGGRMPQKSTYFYPKLITGLVINPVW